MEMTGRVIGRRDASDIYRLCSSDTIHSICGYETHIHTDLISGVRVDGLKKYRNSRLRSAPLLGQNPQKAPDAAPDASSSCHQQPARSLGRNKLQQKNTCKCQISNALFVCAALRGSRRPFVTSSGHGFMSPLPCRRPLRTRHQRLHLPLPLSRHPRRSHSSHRPQPSCFE